MPTSNVVPPDIYANEKKRLTDTTAPRTEVARETVNPTLRVIPDPTGQLILSYKNTNGDGVIRPANAGELAALKICVEEIDIWQVARESGKNIAEIDHILNQARYNELLLLPKPLIARPAEWFPDNGSEVFRTPAVFTLQWHITQACDLHCRHCYDRSARKQVARDDGEKILQSFRRFCDRHHLRGQVSLSGGNPLLHPDFYHLYKYAAELGLGTAILGNPCSREELGRIKSITPPLFYQISLEGLETANDLIRGLGHFRRALAFLDLLSKEEIYSMVMLTLHRENQDELLPLARELEGRCNLFTFNRLAQTGEGQSLSGVDPEGFQDLFSQYMELSGRMEHLALKDNYFNIIKERRGEELFGGCTGFGCGAAFNFISLLPDGEVHACRKFPSKIGDINESDLDTIYHSKEAMAYRQGPADCADCKIRPVCRGCLAVAHGCGHDPFKKHDPYCFRS